MASHACELLKAMANEWRLMILCHLAEGEKTVSQLQNLLGLSQSALSQHLALLREMDLVKTRREAQTIYYSLPDGPVVRILGVLQDIYCPRDLGPGAPRALCSD